MLFKMKLLLCMVALSFASYARAQEKAAKAPNPPAASERGKAESQKDNQTGENQNRQRNQAENPKRSRTDEGRTSEERNRAGRDVNVQRTETVERRAGSSTDKPLDGQLANCLLLGNQKEVTISQFAAERAKHEKVKEFARQMVKDHTQAISMLQRFAGPDASKDLSSGSDATRINRSEPTVNRSATSTDSNRSAPEGEQRNPKRNADRDNPSKSAEATTRTPADSSERTPSDAAARTATNQANRDANPPSERNRSETTVQIRSEHEAIPDKMLAIEREVAQKCIAMAKQELEQSSNFDQAYVGMQISAHLGMIAKLETYKSYASQDLGKVIQESLDTAQGHLRHAKELVMEIGHDSPSSNRSSATSRDSGNRSEATGRSETRRNEASGRDANARNPANREDAGTRREGADAKKDAPKN